MINNSLQTSPSSFYSGLNLNQDKATKLQTVQIVRQSEATPYRFKINPLYFYADRSRTLREKNKCGPNLSKNFSNTNPSTPAWQTMAGIFLYRLPSFVYLATFSLQMTAIEQSFGTLHRKFRYARAAYFGLIKVSAQSHLKVMCLNLLKAANRLSVPVAA